MKRGLRLGLPLALAWFAVAQQGAMAAESALEQARASARRVEALVDRGDWSQAQKLLAEALRACRAAARSKACETLLLYTDGYQSERRAAADPSHRVEHLNRAAAAYERAFGISPENATLMLRLARVLEALGRSDDAIRHLERAARLGGPDQARYRLLAGDVHLRRGERDRALAIYQRVSLASADPASARRIVNLFRSLPPGDPTELVTQAEKFVELGRPEMAVEVLEIAMARCYSQCPSVAERSLVEWAWLRSRGSPLTATSDSALPSEEAWQAPARRQLGRLLRDPRRAGAGAAWWRADAIRRDSAASVMMSRATAIRARGDDEQALAVLEAAHAMAPPFHKYGRGELEGRSAEMEIAVRLASLYDALGRETEFRRLVRELFDEKALHYRNRNGVGIQQAHTALGLIYSERGQYESPSGWEPEGAVFQLRNALKFAKQNRDPDPLPDLERRLGEAYAGVGNDSQAARRFEAAAMGYMDLDNLDPAQRTLERARALGSPSTELAAIEAVLQVRRREDQAVRVVRDADGIPSLSAEVAWLTDPSQSPLEAAFIQRQRFKVLAASGLAAKDVQPGDASYLRAEALKAAAANPDAVSSLRDVTRIKELESSLVYERAKPLDAQRKLDERARWQSSPGGGAEPRIDPKALRAAEILSQPAINSLLYRREHTIDVDGKQVTIRTGAEPAAELPAPKANVLQRFFGIEPKAESVAELEKLSDEQRERLRESIEKLEGFERVRVE